MALSIKVFGLNALRKDKELLDMQMAQSIKEISKTIYHMAMAERSLVITPSMLDNLVQAFSMVRESIDGPTVVSMKANGKTTK